MRSLIAKLRRLAVWALASYGVAVALILYSPVPDWLARPLVVEADRRPADAIVVLSAWATPDRVLNEPGVWRSLEAARLYRQGLAPLIVVTGRSPSGDGGDPSLAISELLQEVGVPAAAIELERVSSNTHESAVNVGRMFVARHWGRILLVTDAGHMRRARGAFLHEGMTVSPAPSMRWVLWWEQPYDRYRKFDAATHEYAGLLYYWWRGWI
jgi:uncharacterized SAM-binding protein YcdF (DUF218 family)